MFNLKNWYIYSPFTIYNQQPLIKEGTQ